MISTTGNRGRQRSGSTAVHVGTAAFGCPVEQRPTGRMLKTHATIWPSALDLQKHRFLGARRSGRQKIEKRSLFGGPCFEGTLQKPTGVSESSPVAGAIEGFHPSRILDAGRARELQKSAQPATQMLSVNCLYQRNAKERKRHFATGRRSLLVWFVLPTLLKATRSRVV